VTGISRALARSGYPIVAAAIGWLGIHTGVKLLRDDQRNGAMTGCIGGGGLLPLLGRLCLFAACGWEPPRWVAKQLRIGGVSNSVISVVLGSVVAALLVDGDIASSGDYWGWMAAFVAVNAVSAVGLVATGVRWRAVEAAKAGEGGGGGGRSVRSAHTQDPPPPLLSIARATRKGGEADSGGAEDVGKRRVERPPMDLVAARRGRGDG